MSSLKCLFFFFCLELSDNVSLICCWAKRFSVSFTVQCWKLTIWSREYYCSALWSSKGRMTPLLLEPGLCLQRWRLKQIFAHCTDAKVLKVCINNSDDAALVTKFHQKRWHHTQCSLHCCEMSIEPWLVTEVWRGMDPGVSESSPHKPGVTRTGGQTG